MLHALASPFVPTSSKGSITKGTWHGVEMSVDTGTGMRTEPTFVMSQTAEAVQIVSNLLPCGPDSKAAAVVKSAWPRVQGMILKLCDVTGGLCMQPTAYGLDAVSVAGICAPAQSSSKREEQVCLACGRVGRNLKHAAWPSHRAACHQAATAKHGSECHIRTVLKFAMLQSRGCMLRRIHKCLCAVWSQCIAAPGIYEYPSVFFVPTMTAPLKSLINLGLKRQRD
eukprot:1145604-Pelagomonas_calceolata.AAC.1